MKAIMVMFDSLNRHMLPPYGDTWVKAPNFQRLADRAVTFDNSYIGSMPCIPARREIHTGRYNFLHRSWGPLEPFDDSMPELLKKCGIYTHLVSDHCHYWEDGGATYHTRYSTWEMARGQCGEPWKGEVADPKIPKSIGRDTPLWRQDWVNRKYLQDEKNHPQAVTFQMGLDFIDTNRDQDGWFLHIETFDPHEPFFAPQKYRDLYPHDYDGPHFDWPDYGRVRQEPAQVEHCRYEYAALVSMCDAYLGKVLDKMDELDLWKDTMLIVNTDHGFLLGEHDWWGKCRQPFYTELARTPLFIWDPRSGAKAAHNTNLVQTIDLAPTLLDYFNVAVPDTMEGRPLGDTLRSGAKVRNAGLFGIFGGHVNVTDGRYVYMRANATPDNRPLNHYTVMPTHMVQPFSVEELRTTELGPAFAFTKGCPTMKIRSHGIPGVKLDPREFGTLLFDLAVDPQQQHPISDPAIERRMTDHLIRLMKDNDAPAEQYERLGLTSP